MYVAEENDIAKLSPESYCCTVCMASLLEGKEERAVQRTMGHDFIPES